LSPENAFPAPYEAPSSGAGEDHEVDVCVVWCLVWVKGPPGPRTTPAPVPIPRPAEQLGAGRVFLWFRAPAPGPAYSPNGSPLKQVGRNGAPCRGETGPHSGNQRGLAPDGSGAGITPKITPPARCKGGAWRVKTRPAPPRNEL